MNLAMITLVSVLLGVELLFAAILVSLFFPQSIDPLAFQLFDIYRQHIIPERDVFFYRLFMAMVLGVFTVLMLLRKRWDTPAGRRAFRQFTVLEAITAAAQVFCAFKLLLFRQIIFLDIYYFVLGSSVLYKAFWPETRRLLDTADRYLKDDRSCRRASPWVRGLFVIVIAAIVWVPDYEGAVARMFIGEQFHHMDFFLMPPAWAHVSGNIVGVDSLSRYGLGAPIFVGEAAQRLMGGFTYEHALLVMVITAIVYYIIWYWALWRFFGTTLVAIVAVLAGMRLQLFHWETFPFIFTYPQTTPLRFFFDAVLFALLVRHLRKPALAGLVLMAIAAGMAVFNITGEGLYILATFYAFLLFREVYALKVRDAGFVPLRMGQRALLAVIPWLTLFSLVWLTVGKYAFTAAFWNDQLEFVRFYKAGHGSLPMMNDLVPGFVLEAGMAFVLPAVYMLSCAGLIGLMAERKIGREGLAALTMMVYLLADLHYHVMVSNNTTGYLRAGPAIAFVTCFWLWLAIGRWDAYRRRLALLAALAVVAVSMLTSHIFLLYPNVFNLSRNPMTHPVVSQNPTGRSSYFNHLFVSYPDAFKLPLNSLGETDEKLYIEKDFADDRALKQFYRQEINYDKDAALIDRLVPPREQAALVSSFEVPILMQAKRRSFFYTLDLVNSRPRRMRNFVITFIYTKNNMDREIGRLETLKPAYLFMEKIFLNRQVPQAYMHDSQDLVTLLGYIWSRYEPAEYGEYLVAMKRKTP